MNKNKFLKQEKRIDSVKPQIPVKLFLYFFFEFWICVQVIVIHVDYHGS